MMDRNEVIRTELAVCTSLKVLLPRSVSEIDVLRLVGHLCHLGYHLCRGRRRWPSLHPDADLSCETVNDV